MNIPNDKLILNLKEKMSKLGFFDVEIFTDLGVMCKVAGFDSGYNKTEDFDIIIYKRGLVKICCDDSEKRKGYNLDIGNINEALKLINEFYYKQEVTK